MICSLCETEIGADGLVSPVGSPPGLRWVHRECMLREVLGGIGHLTNHAYWCSERGDPDGGMTRRESALSVDHWVQVHGVEAASAITSDLAPGEGDLPIPAAWVDDSA